MILGHRRRFQLQHHKRTVSQSSTHSPSHDCPCTANACFLISNYILPYGGDSPVELYVFQNARLASHWNPVFMIPSGRRLRQIQRYAQHHRPADCLLKRAGHGPNMGIQNNLSAHLRFGSRRFILALATLHRQESSVSSLLSLHGTIHFLHRNALAKPPDDRRTLLCPTVADASK